jgi:decaprenyl-phosphate phosphoribosyltransferase
MSKSKLGFMLEALRPRQWIKNLLIFAAPIAAQEFTTYFKSLLLALLGFISCSSFGYLINDWIDKDKDAKHPDKKLRPFASGKLGRGHLIVLLLITLFGIAVPCLVLGSNFTIVSLSYVFLTILYTIRIKQIPVIEMFWLSTGFLIRGVAGSVVIAKNPTSWFLITIFFGSLFLVSTKRLSEIVNVEPAAYRMVVNFYTKDYLSLVTAIAATTTIVTYAIWAIQEHPGSSMVLLSLFSFSAFIFSYLLKSKESIAQEPETLLFSDLPILLSVVTTIILLCLVFYA